MLVVMADESLAIRQLLQQALGMTSGKPAVETVLHEFGRCRYLVQLERGPPRLALLSFATGQSLPDNYRQVMQEAFKGIADITATVEGYQLTLRVRTAPVEKAPAGSCNSGPTARLLQVILEVLTGATHVEQQLALSKLSSLRKVVMAAGVRYADNLVHDDEKNRPCDSIAIQLSSSAQETPPQAGWRYPGFGTNSNGGSSHWTANISEGRLAQAARRVPAAALRG